MDTSQPGPLMMLVGGVVMAIGSLLSWRGGDSGLSLDTMGLFGIITLVVGILVALVGAVNAFGISINLPEKVLGHTMPQLMMVDSFIVFLWTFALVAASSVSAGVHLAWIGAAVGCVGSALLGKSADAGAAS